jgi:hypothetical protein
VSWARRVLIPVVLLAVSASVLPAVAGASGFGFLPGAMKVESLERDGSSDYRAGSHPYAFNIHVALKTSESHSEGGEMRDLIFDLPPGLIGSPLSVPRCSRQSFEGGAAPGCPPSTQIGVVHAVVASIGELSLPLYNVAPGSGQAALFGFSGQGFTGTPAATLLSEEGLPNEAEERYEIRVATSLPIEATSVTATIWGEPADESHKSERGSAGESSDAPPLAFFTLPTSCDARAVVTAHADSALSPGEFASESAPIRSEAGLPASLIGCDSVPFAPTALAGPSTSQAGSPAGLGFQLNLPNRGLLAPSGVTETEPEKTTLTLPAGMTVNPSVASGLGACSEQQFAEVTLTNPGCPDNSKLGTVLAHSPLIEEAIEGALYLATPKKNRFGTLVALYLVARAPERGVLIKQAGRVDIDPGTGQLTTTFDGLPPVPYSSLEVTLRDGSHAPLTTPTTCGTDNATVRLYPFSDPDNPVVQSIPFTVSAGAGGSSCVSSEAQLTNSPSFEAGTVTPLAGAFSPFVFKIAREDGSQHLGAITATLPEGLLGKLAGVPYCSEAQIAAANARSNEGEGAQEQSSPSCPETSQVGVVKITAGAGPEPYPVQGKVYLAGPYKNAPLSLAVITPAVAGPFDLGTVVVRVALYIDENTAQIRAVSDPIPTILDGVPLDVRSVSLNLNRAGFTFNPTSCEAMGVNGQAISTLNQTTVLSNRFQVGGCAGLPFKPTLSASTQGKASRANGASLVVKITAKPGEANIHKVKLQLPVTLPSRLTTLQKACTEAQFNANPAGCPAGSVIGSATAHTPLLQVPLSGPAYLVSHGGAAFPDVEFVLQADERGGDIELVLDGGTQIKKGITYSNFETVPDAPISSFETVLPEGPHSIFAANLPASDNYNLCGQALQMPTTLTGQNGAVLKQNTPISVTGCAAAVRVRKHTVKGNAATLLVSVPSAGRLTAGGPGLTAAAETVSAAKSVTLKLKLNKKEQAFLARHHNRKVRLRIKLNFTPRKGSRLATSATVLIG